MPKWFDETILIKYWEDRCLNYTLQDGTEIQSASRNPSFGHYPDISLNYLKDNRVVPCEIEWMTTNFDRHGHDITLLREQDGFLVVMEQDAGFPVEQVKIDDEDFVSRFSENSELLCRETLSEIQKSTKKSSEPQIYLFHVPIAGNCNFAIALEKGVWGIPSNRQGIRRGLSTIAQIKKNDIVILTLLF